MFNPEYAQTISEPILTVETLYGEEEISWTNLDGLVAALMEDHWRELRWSGGIFDQEGRVGTYFVSEETETVQVELDRMTCWDRANTSCP